MAKRKGSSKRQQAQHKRQGKKSQHDKREDLDLRNQACRGDSFQTFARDDSPILFCSSDQGPREHADSARSESPNVDWLSASNKAGRMMFQPFT